MPDIKEKLVELLDIIIQPGEKTLGDIAEHFIANGVTIKTEPQTNADRLRAMSDEELAEFIKHSICRHLHKESQLCSEWDCTTCVLKWLQQPAEEVDDGT